VLTMGPTPCHRHVQCTRVRVAAALTLLATVATTPGLAPAFSLFASPIRARKQSPSGSAWYVFVGGRTPAGPQACSRLALLAEYDSMKAAQLKALCKEKGLPVSGTKAVLISRLEEADGGPEKEVPADSFFTADKTPSEIADDNPAPKKKKKKVVKKKQTKASEEPSPPALEEEATPEEEEEEEQEEEPKTGTSPTEFQPGDRLNARYHRDNKMYPGILLDVQYDGRYLISWDEPDENEPLTSVTEVEFLKKAKVPLEPGEKQIYHVGDKVFARFPADNNFYEADLLELKGDRCKIKWKDPDGSPPTAEMPVHDIKLKLRAKSAC